MVPAERSGPPPPDESTRREIVASTGKSMLVEAGAGTGKTTLLVDRILRGVRDGAFRMSALVAITYTEKAAGELEARVRARLAGALREGAGSAEERRRLRAAVEELDRATIGTVHAFCSRLLREKAAEAGVDPEFAVLDEAAAQVLRERAWRDWMEEQVGGSPEPLVEAMRAGVKVSRLKELAFALAGAPELLEEGRFEMPVPAVGRGDALAAVLRDADEAGAVLERDVAGKGSKDYHRLLRLTRELGSAASPRGPAARRLVYRLAAIPPEKVLSSIRRSERAAAGAVLGRLHGEARAFSAHLARDVFTWLGGFIEHYGRAKLSRGALDFQDLLLLCARLLRGRTDVRRHFQRRFDAFFVDEFQDTDPLQAEVIAYLCADDETSGAPLDRVRLAEGKLFLVGDPKQSIYRFRRADVRVYDRFRALFGPARFGEDRTRRIFCNFRSTPPLLEWFNGTFERLLGMPTPDGVYQAPHVPLAAPGGAAGDDGPAVVALCPPPGLGSESWRAAQARRHEADCIARLIREAVDGRLPAPTDGITYGSFALLFRALTGTAYYEEALERSGIPYRLVGGRRFYQREQVVEALAVLRAIDDPLAEAAVVGALRSSFFGLSDEELFRYRAEGGRWNYLDTQSRDGPVGEAMRMLADWHGRRNRTGPHVLLREVLDRTKALQAFLLKPAGRQRAANVQKLLTNLRALGEAAGSFGAVVRHLSAVQEAEMPEEESNVLEPGDDVVRLLSMHKAKGLEFDAVVVPDMGRAWRGEAQGAPLVYDRLAGRVGLEVAGGVRSDNYEELARREHGNQLAEEVRLLYVACTRARRLLVLPLYWYNRWHGSKVRTTPQDVMEQEQCAAPRDEAPFGRARDGVLYLDTEAWSESLDAGGLPPRSPERPQEDVAALMAAREEWRQAHARLAERASRAQPFVLPSSLEPEFEPLHLAEGAPEGAGGKDFGSLFHSVMASAPLDGRDGGEVGAAVRALARTEAGALGLDDGAAAEAAELALATLGNDEFAAILDGARSAAREVRFAVPLARLPVCSAEAPGLLEGSIDLLVMRDGGAVVLDYKTDRAAGGGLAALAERYWGQLGLYGLAARACGRAAGDVELVLFFVRSGEMRRRALDEQLLDRLRAEVAGALAEWAEGPGTSASG